MTRLWVAPFPCRQRHPLRSLWDGWQPVSRRDCPPPHTRHCPADKLQLQNIADLQAQGYERLVALGYCRGGSMITYLLEKGDQSPLAAGAIFHPGWEPKRWPLFTKPTFWLLPEHE